MVKISILVTDETKLDYNNKINLKEKQEQKVFATEDSSTK
jgi:hypothetical protein